MKLHVQAGCAAGVMFGSGLVRGLGQKRGKLQTGVLLTPRHGREAATEMMKALDRGTPERAATRLDLGHKGHGNTRAGTKRQRPNAGPGIGAQIYWTVTAPAALRTRRHDITCRLRTTLTIDLSLDAHVGYIVGYNQCSVA